MILNSFLLLDDISVGVQSFFASDGTPSLDIASPKDCILVNVKWHLLFM